MNSWIPAAQADTLTPPPAACSLPVCDIPAAIAALQTDTENQRYVTVNTIRLANKNAVDPAVLQNLMDFGKAAENLFVSIKEEDWLIREADTLYRFAVDGLAKYARPVSSANLIQLYGLLNTEELRYDVLLYWTTQIQTSNSTNDIQQIMTFAKQAVVVSLADQDDDYVGRQAETVLTDGTDRYAQLHPFYEGVFKIDLKCSADSSVVPCPQDFVQGFHRLVILDSQDTAYGLRVSLVSDVSDASIGFDHAVFDAGRSSITSSTQPYEEVGAARDIELTIDPATGKIQGSYEDTQYPGKFLFQGTAIAYVGQELNTPPPSVLDVNQILGSYRGRIGNTQGTLVVKMLAQDRLAASFIATETVNNGDGLIPLIKLDFQLGRWLPNQGLLMLVGVVSETQQQVKLALAFRANNDDHAIHAGTHFEGFEFAQYARVNSVRFISQF
jgi:hypothetical protein